MPRVLVPELLDSLPADHPDAIASRRDLRFLNAIMGNFRWLEKQLTSCSGEDATIVEIGAGDGGLARRVCGRIPGMAARYHAIDLAPQPAAWPAGATWHQTDLWSEAGAALLRRAGILVANLVLHHFDDSGLRRLGSLLTDCQAVLACEPCRREAHVWQGRLLFPFLNKVTRHDMTVSIRAGFRGAELAEALGPQFTNPDKRASGTALGAYRVRLLRTSP